MFYNENKITIDVAYDDGDLFWESQESRIARNGKVIQFFQIEENIWNDDDRISNCRLLKLVKLCCQTILLRSITKIEGSWRSLKNDENISAHVCWRWRRWNDVQLSSDRQSVKLSWLIVGSVPVFPEDVRDVTY